MNDPVRWVILALLGGVLHLDRIAIVQSMASRPLVAGALAGAVVGEPTLGLLCGALIELVWLMDLPVGTSVPPDETLAGLVAAVVAAAFPGSWGLHARAGLAVFVALPFGHLGRWADSKVREGNVRLLARARQALAEGARAPLGRLHWTGAARFFGMGVALTAFGCCLGVWGVRVGLEAAPPWVPATGELLEAFLPVAGAAGVMGRLGGRAQWAGFGLGWLGGWGGSIWTGGGAWPR